jgi:hypothetical protein
VRNPHHGLEVTLNRVTHARMAHLHTTPAQHAEGISHHCFRHLPTTTLKLLLPKQVAPLSMPQRDSSICCLTLTATTSPASQQASAAPFSDSCALCTWPMLPQAMGTSSIQSNSWSGGSANELCSALQVYLRNIEAA